MSPGYRLFRILRRCFPVTSARRGQNVTVVCSMTTFGSSLPQRGKKMNRQMKHISEPSAQRMGSGG
jgi:hypothetical protein